MPRSITYPTHWTTDDVSAELRKRSRKRAEIYDLVFTHEYQETSVIADKCNGLTTNAVQAHLSMLRQLGLLKCAKVEGSNLGPRRIPLKWIKCEHPLLVPQDSPYKRDGAKKRAAVKAPRTEKKRAGRAAPRKPAQPLADVMAAAAERLTAAMTKSLEEITAIVTRVSEEEERLAVERKQLEEIRQRAHDRAMEIASDFELRSKNRRGADTH